MSTSVDEHASRSTPTSQGDLVDLTDTAALTHDLRLMARAIRDSFRVSGAAIHLLQGGKVKLTVGDGELDCFRGVDTGQDGLPNWHRMFENDACLVGGNLSGSRPYSAAHQHAAGAPLRVNGHLIGAFCLHDYPPVRGVDSIWLLKTAAVQVAHLLAAHRQPDDSFHEAMAAIRISTTPRP